jgi:hypothetical protein
LVQVHLILALLFYWKNNNKNGEKMEFIRLHSLRSWFKLPENDKKQHQIEDCDKCQSIISNAILHTRSASEGTFLHAASLMLSLKLLSIIGSSTLNTCSALLLGVLAG